MDRGGQLNDFNDLQIGGQGGQVGGQANEINDLQVGGQGGQVIFQPFSAMASRCFGALGGPYSTVSISPFLSDRRMAPSKSFFVRFSRMFAGNLENCLGA